MLGRISTLFGRVFSLRKTILINQVEIRCFVQHLVTKTVTRMRCLTLLMWARIYISLPFYAVIVRINSKHRSKAIVLIGTVSTSIELSKATDQFSRISIANTAYVLTMCIFPFVWMSLSPSVFQHLNTSVSKSGSLIRGILLIHKTSWCTTYNNFQMGMLSIARPLTLAVLC